MMDRRRVLLSSLVALVAAGTLYGDMMPVGRLEVGAETAAYHGFQAESHNGRDATGFDSDFYLFDLGGGWQRAWPELKTSVAEASGPEHYLGLTEGSTSFDLCLYGLMSLGLCRVGGRLRRSSFGFVPDWYHNGGPFQIGHCHRISVDCVCSAPVCVFQPDDRDNEKTPQRRPGTVIARWRCSQFTPSILASRAPPRVS